ncbi:MAG: peptidase [Bacteroidetes bacterium]|nr:peptidase [Bacteroidota bacterium]
MKNILLLVSLLAFLLLPAGAADRLNEFLVQIEAKDIRLLESESNYDTIMEILIEQPIDHRNPEVGSFTQRIYISHFDPGSPVVLVTAGYDANYYYTSELAAALRCNQVMVEHRYFGKSRPDSIQWEYLDTWQAASDHHRIIELFKELYPGQWIATGISKGGQTVMYHSYYYPGDVDVRIPYVAPLNFGVEDKRIYSFLGQVGSKGDRRKVKRFQKNALKYQERYLPAFKEFSREKGYTYEIAGGYKNAYEYCALEYSFAFWQWGYVPSSKIPGKSNRPREFIEHMNRVAGFDYFSDEAILKQRPFFYQALTEMGYYGYDLPEFDKYIQHVSNPVFTFTIPEELKITFDSTLSEELEQYLASEAERFIYIYGEYDTWSATAVTATGDTESKIFIKEGGSHRTRINNMPKEQKKEVYETLELYLKLALTPDH